jgi:hypothetical protein
VLAIQLRWFLGLLISTIEHHPVGNAAGCGWSCRPDHFPWTWSYPHSPRPPGIICRCSGGTASAISASDQFQTPWFMDDKLRHHVASKLFESLSLPLVGPINPKTNLIGTNLRRQGNLPPATWTIIGQSMVFWRPTIKQSFGTNWTWDLWKFASAHPVIVSILQLAWECIFLFKTRPHPWPAGSTRVLESGEFW